MILFFLCVNSKGYKNKCKMYIMCVTNVHLLILVMLGNLGLGQRPLICRKAKEGGVTVIHINITDNKAGASITKNGEIVITCTQHKCKFEQAHTVEMNISALDNGIVTVSVFNTSKEKVKGIWTYFNLDKQISHTESCTVFENIREIECRNISTADGFLIICTASNISYNATCQLDVKLNETVINGNTTTTNSVVNDTFFTNCSLLVPKVNALKGHYEVTFNVYPFNDTKDLGTNKTFTFEPGGPKITIDDCPKVSEAECNVTCKCQNQTETSHFYWYNENGTLLSNDSTLIFSAVKGTFKTYCEATDTHKLFNSTTFYEFTIDCNRTSIQGQGLTNIEIAAIIVAGSAVVTSILITLIIINLKIKEIKVQKRNPKLNEMVETFDNMDIYSLNLVKQDKKFPTKNCTLPKKRKSKTIIYSNERIPYVN